MFKVNLKPQQLYWRHDIKVLFDSMTLPVPPNKKPSGELNSSLNIFLIMKREIRKNLIQSPKLSSIKLFCSTLYKKRNNKTETHCSNYLKTLNLPRFTDSVRVNSLYRRECWEALQTMGNSKSPGNDGLSKDFLCLFP